MRTINGKQFRNLVRGSGFTMKQICEEAGVGHSVASQWCNDRKDVLLNGTYNKLIAAYERLLGLQND